VQITGKKPAPVAPDIYQYWDYRPFLSDWFIHQKAVKPAFSHRFFCRRAGFKSSSAMKLIIDRKRNLSRDSLDKVAAALGLDNVAATFFAALVLFSQTSDTREKARLQAELMKLKQRHDVNIHELDIAKYRFYSEWYHTVIREMVELPDARTDPAWFAETIYPKISVQKARESIQILLSLGLIEKDKKGRYRVREQAITTPEEVKSEWVAGFNREMIRLAVEASIKLPQKNREVSGLTLRISRPCFEQIKKRILAFKKELLEMAVLDENSDQVYQLNLQWFPLIKRRKEQG